jgi:hypothetical protein
MNTEIMCSKFSHPWLPDIDSVCWYRRGASMLLLSRYGLVRCGLNDGSYQSLGPGVVGASVAGAVALQTDNGASFVEASVVTCLVGA